MITARERTRRARAVRELLADLDGADAFDVVSAALANLDHPGAAVIEFCHARLVLVRDRAGRLLDGGAHLTADDK